MPMTLEILAASLAPLATPLRAVAGLVAAEPSRAFFADVADARFVGVAVNGVAVGLPDDAAVVDACGGETPFDGGGYRYRGFPRCVAAALGDASSIVAWAADGFPIYGPYYAGGDAPVASGYRGNGTWTGGGDLDACNGRFGPTRQFPQGIYHYVFTETYPGGPFCFGRATPPDCDPDPRNHYSHLNYFWGVLLIGIGGVAAGVVCLVCGIVSVRCYDARARYWASVRRRKKQKRLDRKKGLTECDILERYDSYESGDGDGEPLPREAGADLDDDELLRLVIEAELKDTRTQRVRAERLRLRPRTPPRGFSVFTRSGATKGRSRSNSCPAALSPV